MSPPLYHWKTGPSASAWLVMPLPAMARERMGRALDLAMSPAGPLLPRPGRLSVRTGQDTVRAKGPFLERRLPLSKALRLPAQDAPSYLRTLLGVRCGLNAEEANQSPETPLPRGGLDWRRPAKGDASSKRIQIPRPTIFIANIARTSQQRHARIFTPRSIPRPITGPKQDISCARLQDCKPLRRPKKKGSSQGCDSLNSHPTTHDLPLL